MSQARGRKWWVVGALAVAAAAGLGPRYAARAESPAASPPVGNPPAPGGAAPAAGPRAGDAAPALSAADAERIAAAIGQLGSGNFEVRERAAQTLWSMGDKAVPALREAAEGGDPETALRAKAVLDNFAYGVRPDTPKPVIDLLEQYRAANAVDRRIHVARQLTGQDLAGARVLLKLAQDETDVTTRTELLGILVTIARPTAARLLGQQDDAAAARAMLQAVSGLNESSARDWAAFLALRGGIDDEIKRLAALPKGDAGAGGGHEMDANLRLAYLHRANGDLTAARAAAAKADDASTLLALMHEAGDWAALADRAAADQLPAEFGPVEQFGYATAYSRLAGRAADADRFAAKLAAHAADSPSEHWHVAEGLLLNGRADAALAVLRRHGSHALEMEFRGARLDLAASLEVAKLAKAEGSADLPRVRAKSAVAMHFMGRKADARAALDAAVSGEDGPVDFPAYLEVIEAGRATLQPQADVDGWCVAALRIMRQNRGPESPAKVFEKAGFARAEQAAEWWTAMRDTRAGEPQAATFARLRALDRKELPEAELTALLDETRQAAAHLPPPQRDGRLSLIADTLLALGRADDALAAADRLAAASETPAAYARVGDAAAAAGNWARAADAYGNAVRLGWGPNRTPAKAMLLRGWALTKAGRAAEGRAEIDAAHVVALGDEAARHELMQEAAKRGLKDDAARERAMILRTAEFACWERSDALRREAGAAAARGDYLASADLWDRAFLNNFSRPVQFVEPSANLMIPVMIQRVRAEGLAKAGRIEDALREAKACFDNCPGEADAQIAIVNALDAAGRRAEADRWYAKPKAFYAKLAADHPDSGPAHNLLAWYTGRCRRDLDQALAHAKRAVELEPKSTAILDTLAEVHHQRGERDAALELVRKLMKLEPNSEHHRKNLDRFMAGREKDAATPNVEGE